MQREEAIVDYAQLRVRLEPSVRATPHTLLVRRQSPNWELLARIYAVEGRVQPRSYLPPFRIPGFPSNLEQLIDSWNAQCRIDYFSFRARLKQIADENNRSCNDTLVIDYIELDNYMRLSDGSGYICFFDDDDWFAPTIAAHLRHLAPDIGVAIYPLPVLGVDHITLVHKDDIGGSYIGRNFDFDLSVHTNNYAVSVELLTRYGQEIFRDHVIASTNIERLGIHCQYNPVIISATIKTLASAGSLARVLSDGAFDQRVIDFVRAINQIDIPRSYQWLSKPLGMVRDLFEAAK
jgi:hypothetical protein